MCADPADVDLRFPFRVSQTVPGPQKRRTGRYANQAKSCPIRKGGGSAVTQTKYADLRDRKRWDAKGAKGAATGKILVAAALPSGGPLLCQRITVTLPENAGLKAAATQTKTSNSHLAGKRRPALRRRTLRVKRFAATQTKTRTRPVRKGDGPAATKTKAFMPACSNWRELHRDCCYT